MSSEFSFKTFLRGRRLPDGNPYISDEVFTENGLSTELGTSWGPGEFGEHVPDVHQHRRTPTCNPRRPTVFCKRSMKDFRGGPASFSTIFANTKCGRFTWPFPWKCHHGN